MSLFLEQFEMAGPGLPVELIANVSLTMPVHFRFGPTGFIESVLFGLPDLQAYWAPPVIDDDDFEQYDRSREDEDNDGFNISEDLLDKNEDTNESGIISDVSMDEVIDLIDVDSDEDDSDDEEVVFLEEVISLD